VISGTPTAPSSTINCAVTATNSAGSTTAIVSITVNDIAPAGLSYSTNPATYNIGQSIAPNTPTSTGGAVTAYSINPALPAGLRLDPTTGVISGAPTAPSSTINYAVTATNSAGSTTAIVSITVNDIAPAGLSYSTNPAFYMTGQPWQPITPNTPSSSGGAVTVYSISPPLPPGLFINSHSGVISGTPTAPSYAVYKVTAANSGGSTTATLTMSVYDAHGVLAVGSGHACAIVNGGVQCWGANDHGQLGNNTTTPSQAPVAVSQLPSGSGVLAVVAGEAHTCAIVRGGVECWGYNNAGQLGNSTMGDLGNHSSADSHVPVGVTGLPSGSGVQAIAAGRYHTCALLNGGVQCWGVNYDGELGNGAGNTSTVPIAVLGLPQNGIATAIATGGYHSCALLHFDGGSGLRCWGNNQFGQLGNNATTPSSVPVEVSGLGTGKDIRAIGAGLEHTCALVNGDVQCWGSNGVGQLGNCIRYLPQGGCDPAVTESHVPIVVGTGLPLYSEWALAVGWTHTCGLAYTSAGVQCWGVYSDTGPTSTPAWVRNLGSGSGVLSIAAGAGLSCALVGGSVLCWGTSNGVPTSVGPWAQ
jgi:hypothetical protein